MSSCIAERGLNDIIEQILVSYLLSGNWLTCWTLFDHVTFLHHVAIKCLY